MTDKLMLAAMGIFIIPLLGCHSVNKCEQSISEHPPAAVKEKIERLLPLVLEWYTLVEQQLLPQGRRLSPTEQQRARELGVQAPQEVRVVVLEAFPLPENETLCQEAIKHGYGGPDEGGRTHGYVIMLKPEFEDDSAILSHELIHVAQHDRMGREAFLRQYLIELETVGYARSPLELEAYGRQQRID